MERRCNCFPFMYEPRPGATGRALFNHIIVQMYEKKSRMLSPLVGDAKNLIDYAFSSSFSFLYQLIFDLKNVNPKAAISVKLVAESGVVANRLTIEDLKKYYTVHVVREK